MSKRKFILLNTAFSTYVAAPLFGKLFDRFRSARILSTIGMILVFGGSLLFTIQNPYSILFGRFLAGLGLGLEGAILGMVAKVCIGKL